MSNLEKLRVAAQKMFEEATRVVDARRATRSAFLVTRWGYQLFNQSEFLSLENRKVFSVALGKAAAPMAYALEERLGPRFAGGLLSGPLLAKTLGLSDLKDWTSQSRWRVVQGGHPLPDETSLMAAREAFDVLERANAERALLVFLVSGGGSAMMEWPINQDVSLADLRSANEVLVSCGAAIGEINAVRRAFSAIKGGRLAARAPNCEQLTFIVSDVPSGQAYDVASGPTLRAPASAPAAVEVIERYNLRAQLPTSIVHTIDDQTSAELSFEPGKHFVILDNEYALRAAREARPVGFVEPFLDVSDEPIEAGCEKLWASFAESVESMPPHGPPFGVCLVSGGEFSCPVRGNGLGGRNAETALRLAIAAQHDRDRIQEFVALCVGTDGIDGNSSAAGAIVDSTTISRARSIGLNPMDFLNRSDSHSFFVALGDAITTGATGTNVRDIRVLLAPNPIFFGA